MKNKLLSLFLILSLVMSFFSFPAIINAQDYSFTQSIEEYKFSGSSLSVTAKISNSGSAKLSANGYAAVYSIDGNLKGVNSCTVSVSANNSVTVIYEIENYTFSSGDYVKAFLWDANHMPLAEYVQETVAIGEQIEGIVLETYLSSPYYEEGDNTVDILITKDSASCDAGEVWSFVADGTNAADYLGYTVTAIVGENSDGYDAVFDIAPKEGANTLVTLPTDLINEISDEMISYYKTETAKATTEAEIQTWVYVKYDEFDTSGYFIVVNGFNTGYDYVYNFFDIVYYLDEISLLDNDNDGDFEFIFATMPDIMYGSAIEFVAEEIEVEDGFYYIGGEDSAIEFDTSDPNMYIRVIKDGVVTTPDAISIGDTITCLDASVNVLTVYVSSESVTGVIEEVADYIYYINGTPYTLSVLSSYYYEDLCPGDEGTFHINAFGEIAYIAAPPVDMEYFYLTAADALESDFGEEQCFVKGITESGEEKVFAIQPKKVDVYEDYYEENLYAEEAYQYVKGYEGLIGITLNDEDEISAFYFPGYDDSFLEENRYEIDAAYQSGYYNKARGTYGTVDLNEDTLIFNVDTYDETVAASTVGELFVDGESYSFIAYGEEDSVAEVLVTFDIEMPKDEIEDPEPVVGESEYVFIINSAYEYGTFGSASFFIQTITTTGEIKAYTIMPKKVDVYTEDGVEESLYADAAFDIIFDYYGIAKIALTEDGEIADFYLPGSEGFAYDVTYEDDSDAQTSYYNQASGTYGTVALKPDTVIFNINTYDDEVCASTVGKAFVNGSSYSFESYGQNTSSPEALVTYDVELPEIEEEEPVVGESEYVFIIGSGYEKDKFGEKSFLIQAVTADGEVKILPINSKKVDIYTEDGVEEALLDEEAFDILYYYVDIAKIALTEDGCIADFYLPGCDEFTYNEQYAEDFDYESAEYNAETLTYGTVSIDSETVLYNIDNTEASYADGVSVGKAVDLLQHGSSYSFVAYGKEGAPADIILTFDLKVSFNAEAPVMVVTRVSEVLAEDEVTTKITGVTAGETVSVIVDPDEAWGIDIEVGNVIMCAVSDGYAVDVQVLFTSTDYEPGFLQDYLNDILTGEFSDESVTIHYGEITDKTSKTITLDDEYKFYFSYDINVIVVDYTGAKVSIQPGSLSDVKESSIYTRTAFVKTNSFMEDEVSDVVVFIQNW